MAGGSGREDGEAEAGSCAWHLKPVGLREKRMEVDISHCWKSSLCPQWYKPLTSLTLWTIKSL